MNCANIFSSKIYPDIFVSVVRKRILTNIIAWPTVLDACIILSMNRHHLETTPLNRMYIP